MFCVYFCSIEFSQNICAALSGYFHICMRKLINSFPEEIIGYYFSLQLESMMVYLMERDTLHGEFKNYSR